MGMNTIKIFYINFVPFISLFCIIIFITQRRFLLICLLSLECLILRILYIIILSLRFKDIYLLLIILAIAACEARLGLAIVVTITRFIGNDKIFILKFFKC